MAKPRGYSRLQIVLHWAIAVLIIAAFFTHEVMHQAFDDRLASGVMPGLSDGTLHTMLGGLVFLLVVIRVIVRLGQGAPDPVDGTSETMARAAHIGHMVIYALIVGIPLGGMVAWFGGLEFVGNVHGIAGKALMLIVLGHAIMALYHQYVVKDGTLARMMRSER